MFSFLNDVFLLYHFMAPSINQTFFFHFFSIKQYNSPGVATVWSTRYRDHFRGVHSDASPALLCHKEPAQGTQSPLLGAFLPFAGSLWHKDKWLHARKGPIMGGFMHIKNL